MVLAACVIVAYFVGSIPIGFLVARAQGIDIFKVGSGSIGATNVARSLGSKLGLLVFLLDVLKGFLPTLAAFYIFRHNAQTAFIVGIGAVVGHCLSIFLKFKGGKAVATGLGVLFGSCPLVGASALCVFIVCMAITRFVSLSSILAALSLIPFGFLYKLQLSLIFALCGLCIFVIYRHRGNVKRLLNGKEPKFRFGKPIQGEEAVVEGDDPQKKANSSGAALLGAPPHT
ncbi:MAG TPA: glycerol-3-phosphate 1-O-acyltransferase PlsY [Fimbriimonadaceae bacterium]|jgi:glycerol-3-phosphate acyltransferase PlsY